MINNNMNFKEAKVYFIDDFNIITQSLLTSGIGGGRKINTEKTLNITMVNHLVSYFNNENFKFNSYCIFSSHFASSYDFAFKRRFCTKETSKIFFLIMLGSADEKSFISKLPKDLLYNIFNNCLLKNLPHMKDFREQEWVKIRAKALNSHKGKNKVIGQLCGTPIKIKPKNQIAFSIKPISNEHENDFFNTTKKNKKENCIIQ